MSESEKLLEKYGFKPEVMELAINQWGKTSYPSPKRRFWLSLEAYNQSIEDHYHWIYDYMLHDLSFPHTNFIKIVDTSTAAEGSSFFGSGMQRLGLQQDKISQFLATAGKMIKEMFQLVRELRILDERLSYYEDSMDADSKSRKSAEITLKGIWIDMVEQGGKNPSSVYGMARELQFTTLPDLFYNTHPLKGTDVDKVVDKLDFNRKVKEVLKRKLRTFLEWKEHSYREIKTRRKFTLKYLRQHFDIIRMYMAWVKPYLKYVKRLMMNDKMLDDPKLVGAFETMTIEVEYLAYKFPSNKEKPQKSQNKSVYSVILVTFEFKSHADMTFNQDGYQHKGPLHVGSTEFYVRAYTWTKKEIDNYVKYREEEDFDLMGIIDGTVKAAMDALGDELRDYLIEAGEKDENIIPPKQTEESPEEPEEQPPGMLDPLSAIGDGFKGILGAVTGTKNGDSLQGKYVRSIEDEAAWNQIKSEVYYIYKNFKKGHKLFSL
ncbi:hypothetical protein K9M79_00270 [Candidatus Woesearchaeota archaeon]|nr:hypothetical protein [Candidatus Woesearchaeota archaeon]